MRINLVLVGANGKVEEYSGKVKEGNASHLDDVWTDITRHTLRMPKQFELLFTGKLVPAEFVLFLVKGFST